MSILCMISFAFYVVVLYFVLLIYHTVFTKLLLFSCVLCEPLESQINNNQLGLRLY